MKITLFGNGKMGELVKKLALEEGHTFHEIGHSDVCIDFSRPEKVLTHLDLALSHKTPIVIGTTGWDAQISQVESLVKKSQTAALYSPNFSIGVALFIHLLKQAAPLFAGYDCAGVEYHHKTKADAPSGTARFIAQALHMKTPFASLRCGHVPGKHEVIFDSPFDTITLTHEARSREGFARGSLVAAKWLQHKRGWYTLDDMLRDLYRTDHTL